MIAPAFPANEIARQRAVERYDILDTAPEPDYDSITELMAHICDVPVSLITLLDNDRNFLKSHHGIEESESPREISFCGHAINSNENVMIVENALDDERFVDNPLVTELGVRFYAGSPLVTPDGFRLGTLCVFDMQPRILDDESITALKSLAKQVEIVLQLRYLNKQLLESHQKLETQNQDLKDFASVVTHDIKSPMISVSYLADRLLENYVEPLGEDGTDCVQRIQGGVRSTLSYVNNFLDYCTSDSLFGKSNEKVAINDLKGTLKELVAIDKKIDLTIDSSTANILVNRSAVVQVLLNLITNSIKYNTSDPIKIKINILEAADGYEFIVTDNGDGIPDAIVDKVFELFVKSDSADSQENEGAGIGLSTVRKLVKKMGGEIRVDSTSSEGTAIYFNIQHDE